MGTDLLALAWVTRRVEATLLEGLAPLALLPEPSGCPGRLGVEWANSPSPRAAWASAAAPDNHTLDAVIRWEPPTFAQHSSLPGGAHSSATVSLAAEESANETPKACANARLTGLSLKASFDNRLRSLAALAPPVSTL
ncbi:unnamed protein product [Sphagnum balticum]